MTPPDNADNSPRLGLREMLELATLDVFGLLDEHERRAFDAALAAMPPAQQDQVRAQQALSARCTHLLPDVEPRPELRQLVLGRVKSEADADRDVVARLGAIAAVGRGGISRVWRTAAMGSMAASILLGLMLVLFYREFSNLQHAARLAASDQDFASTFENNWAMVLNKQGAVHQALTPIEQSGPDPAGRGSSSRAQGFLLYDPERQATLLLATALPVPNAEYGVYLVGEETSLPKAAIPVPTLVKRITALQDRIFQVLEIQPSPGRNKTYQIVAFVPETQQSYQVFEVVF